MKPIRFNYASELDAETKEVLKKADIKRQSLTEITLPVSAIAPDGSTYLHAVEASCKNKVIHIRVIVRGNQGVTISIMPRDDMDIMLKKYRDLRYLIRNRDYVLVTFPWVEIKNAYGNMLWVRANDFKVVEPETEAPAPTVFI